MMLSISGSLTKSRHRVQPGELEPHRQGHRSTPTTPNSHSRRSCRQTITPMTRTAMSPIPTYWPERVGAW